MIDDFYISVKIYKIFEFCVIISTMYTKDVKFLKFEMLMMIIEISRKPKTTGITYNEQHTTNSKDYRLTTTD